MYVISIWVLNVTFPFINSISISLAFKILYSLYWKRNFKLPYDPPCPPSGWSIGQSVSHDYLLFILNSKQIGKTEIGLQALCLTFLELLLNTLTLLTLCILLRPINILPDCVWNLWLFWYIKRNHYLHLSLLLHIFSLSSQFFPAPCPLPSAQRPLLPLTLATPPHSRGH